MKSLKNNSDNIYQPGDIVDNWVDKIPVPVVDSNHCGMLWPVFSSDNDDGYIMGAICIHDNSSSLLLDAKTGKLLSDEEIKLRLNNYDFDYNDRVKKNTGRRYPVPKKFDVLTCPICQIPSVIQAILQG